MAGAKNNKEIDLPSSFAKVAPPKSIIDILKQGKRWAVCTSSYGTQLSYIRPDQSMIIYTYHLIEVLRGARNREVVTGVHLSNQMDQ